MTAAATILMLAKLWLWVGAGVAAVFLLVGIGRIDEDARDTYVFRVLLIPGILLIWPLVLLRWLRIERGEPFLPRYQPPTAHRAAALFMAVAITIALVLSYTARQHWPADFVPQKVSEAPT